MWEICGSALFLEYENNAGLSGIFSQGSKNVSKLTNELFKFVLKTIQRFSRRTEPTNSSALVPRCWNRRSHTIIIIFLFYESAQFSWYEKSVITPAVFFKRLFQGWLLISCFTVIQSTYRLYSKDSP